MRRYIDLKLRKRKMWTPCTVELKWGAPCLTGGGGMGASVGSEFILFSPFLVSMWLSTSLYIPIPVLFHLLGAGSTEKGRCPTGGSPEIRDGGTALGG